MPIPIVKPSQKCAKYSRPLSEKCWKRTEITGTDKRNRFLAGERSYRTMGMSVRKKRNIPAISTENRHETRQSQSGMTNVAYYLASIPDFLLWKTRSPGFSFRILFFVFFRFRKFSPVFYLRNEPIRIDGMFDTFEPFIIHLQQKFDLDVSGIRNTMDGYDHAFF